MNPDDTTHQSADDALQPAGSTFNPTTDEEHLENDGPTPAAPPTDTGNGGMPADHPQTDTGMDQHETYDEGLAGAAGVNDQQETSSNAPQPLEPQDNTPAGAGTPPSPDQPEQPGGGQQ